MTSPTTGIELARPGAATGPNAGFLRQVVSRRAGLIGAIILLVFIVLRSPLFRALRAVACLPTRG